MFSPSNKIHREVGRAKDLSAPRYTGISGRHYSCSVKMSANEKGQLNPRK
jgi:hypothetical protein